MTGDDTREAILQFIGDYIIAFGYAPSHEEIAGAVDRSSQIVRKHLDILARQGRITYFGRDRQLNVLPDRVDALSTEPTPEEIDYCSRLLAALLPAVTPANLARLAPRVAKLRKERAAQRST